MRTVYFYHYKTWNMSHTKYTLSLKFPWPQLFIAWRDCCIAYHIASWRYSLTKYDTKCVYQCHQSLCLDKNMSTHYTSRVALFHLVIIHSWINARISQTHVCQKYIFTFRVIHTLYTLFLTTTHLYCSPFS